MNHKFWMVGLITIVMLTGFSVVGAQAQPGGQTMPQQDTNDGRLTQVVRRGVLRLAAEETGLTVREIIGEIRSGKSLSDVLTEHGVDTVIFIDDAAAQLEQRLERAVTRGRISQEQADQMLSDFRERLTERLDHNSSYGCLG